MELQLDRILLQGLMVLFPLVLYMALDKNERSANRERAILALLCMTIMVLFFMVSIKVSPGVFLDLRMVPWYMAFIYGGHFVGICVTLFFCIVRIFIGGPGMVPALIVIIFWSFALWGAVKKYPRLSLKNKLVCSTVLLIVASASIPVIGSIILNEKVTLLSAATYLCFILENAIIIWLSVYLLETHLERRSLLKELQRAETFNVVGQLAASVAHEIRNPMTSIRGFIQLLQSSENLTNDEKSFLKISLDEVDRANSIIGDYLSMGKESSFIKKRDVDLSAVISKSINTLSSYAAFNNTEVMLHDHNKVFIEGQPQRLQQMFINLIKNAIEATSSSGLIEIWILSDEDRVLVKISDDGEGMPQYQIDNLGLPFYSTKEKGTGLGLMVVLKVIKEMGGSLKVTSAQGKGTVFNIFFPLKTK